MSASPSLPAPTPAPTPAPGPDPAPSLSPAASPTPGRFRTVALRLLLFAAVAAAVALVSSSFVVNENEHVIVTRFGRPVRELAHAGWYARFPPPLEQLVRVDTRLQHGQIRLSETLTADKRNVIIPLTFAWRVAAPLTWHTHLGTVEATQQNLDSLLTSARNSVLGQCRFEDLFQSRGDHSTLADIERQILELTTSVARQRLGIELVSLGLTEIKLPQANTTAVFQRMRAERTREAATFRAEGRAEAERIGAQTQRQRVHLLAEARRQADEIRGQAEGDAAALYAQTHGQHLEFYQFLRSLQSLRSVVDQNTTLVLDTSAPPFHLLQSGAEKALRNPGFFGQNPASGVAKSADAQTTPVIGPATADSPSPSQATPPQTTLPQPTTRPSASESSRKSANWGEFADANPSPWAAPDQAVSGD